MLFRKYTCSKCGGRLNVDPYADECTCESCGYRQRVGRGSIGISFPERKKSDHTVQKEYEKRQKRKTRTSQTQTSRTQTNRTQTSNTQTSRTYTNPTQTRTQSAQTKRKPARTGNALKIGRLLFIIILLNVAFTLYSVRDEFVQGIRQIVTDIGDYGNDIDDWGDDTYGGDEEENPVFEDEDAKLTFMGYNVEEEAYGYINFQVLVRNDSDTVLTSIRIDMDCLDENEDFSDEIYAYSDCRVFPGQTIAIQDAVSAEQVESIIVTGYEMEAEDESTLERIIEEMDSFQVNKPGEIVLEEATVFEDSAIQESIATDAEETLSFEKIEVTNYEGYASFKVIATNDTEEDIENALFTGVVLDKNGNILGPTYASVFATVEVGERIEASGTVTTNEDTYLTVDGYSYYNSDGEYVKGYFSEIPQAVSLGQ